MGQDKERLGAENERLRSAVKELAVINEILTMVSSTMSEEEISRHIMKKVVVALNAREAAVFTFSDDPDHLQPVTFVRGKRDSSSQVTTKIDIRVAGWVAKHKKPLVINDVAHDPLVGAASTEPSSLKSILAVPLTAKGKLLGVLTAFDSAKPAGFGEDDVRLLAIIGMESAQILENARLYRQEIRLKEIQGELAAARKIQSGLLPTSVPPIEGYEIYAGTMPAKEVGGDFFDFISFSSERLYFSLGDVSGKGLPAALLMATIQAQLRVIVNREFNLPPGDILTELNGVTCQLTTSAQYATMLVGCISVAGGDMTIANGGHVYPLLIRADGTIAEMTESGLIVGKFPQAKYESWTCRLNTGDLLVIASDGIQDAADAQENQYGEEAFSRFLVSHRDLQAEKLYEAVIRDVDQYRGQAEQFDDITLMIIQKK
ncbi:MAG: SpoIIE family protein phosphatase [candidate division Zixibacteria bacterium]|nr:SpoIIE family protein phosphatase [candidate division Zixibacteria bacterium]